MLQLTFHTCLQTDTKHNELEAGFSTGKQHVVVSRRDSTLKNCKNEKISLKNRNQVQKKSKHYSHRREVMLKSEYPEEAILHLQSCQKLNSISGILPLTKFCWCSIILTTSGAILKFSLCWHTIRFQNFQKFFKFSIAPVGITLLLRLSGHYLPRHAFSIKATGFEDI